MKTILNILLATVILQGCAAVKISTEKETIQIKTNAECNQCKERLEGELNYVKGIVFAELDAETKVLTVKYKKDQISSDEIRKRISEIGYDADHIKANAASQEALPKCCQPNGMSH